MINHPETLKLQSAEIKTLLAGMRLSTAYTFQKNILHLEFSGKESKTLFFNAAKGKSYIYLLNGKFKPKKKQTVQIFEELEGLNLISDKISDEESVLSFQFEQEMKLNFILQGSQPNAVIFNSDFIILNSFKSPSKFKGKLYDDLFSQNRIQKVENITQFKKSLKSEPSVILKKALRISLNAVNKTISDELIFDAGLEPDVMSHTLSEANYKKLWKANNSVKSAFAKPIYLIYNTSPPLLSLTELSHLKGTSQKTYDSINDAIFEATIAVDSYENLSKKKREAVKGLKSKLKSVTVRTKKQKSDLLKLQDRKDWDKIADLLISNLTLFKKGMTSVSLTDFDGNEVEIKIDPLLPPAANAQRYYKKSKSARSGEKKLENVIASGETEIPNIMDQIREIENISSMSEWKYFEKDLKKKKTPLKKKEDIVSYPYKKYDAGNGYSILVGKSAKDNDKLTLKIAKKNDLWLHVQGAQGSHVVVPAIKKGEQFPREIIIQAAQLAARNSSQKHSGIVSVNYTLCKYVWKKKGMPPGAVYIKNEKSINVKPGR